MHSLCIQSRLHFCKLENNIVHKHRMIGERLQKYTSTLKTDYIFEFR